MESNVFKTIKEYVNALKNKPSEPMVNPLHGGGDRQRLTCGGDVRYVTTAGGRTEINLTQWGHDGNTTNRIALSEMGAEKLYDWLGEILDK